VRFSEDTKEDKVTLETDMQTFEEIPFFEGEADSVSSPIITEKTSDNKEVIIAGTIENLVSRLADQGIPGKVSSIFHVSRS
jgi:hypothetical protein